jgi:hypothetical protein
MGYSPKGSSLPRPVFAASLPNARQSATVLHLPYLNAHSALSTHIFPKFHQRPEELNHHIVCILSDVDVFLDNPEYDTYIRMRFKSVPYFDG